MAGYQEGQTLYDPTAGKAITLQRGQDGVLKWSDPVQMPSGTTGHMPPLTPSVDPWEDIAKTAGPAVERAGAATLTSIPTIADLAAKGAAAGASYLPEGIGSKVQSGAQATSDFLKPFTYPSVQGRVESTYNQTHKDPLYYPQTTPGQFLEAGVGGVGAAAGGPISMARALSMPLGKLGARLATGVGGAMGGEAAGQLADQADLGPYVSGGARVMGDVLGAKGASEGPRSVVTPYPAVSKAHTDMADLLAKQPGNITTAGQYTGNPKLLQREGNLAPSGPAPYNNLGVQQPQADTSSLGASMGLDPAAIAKRGISSPDIKQGKKDLGTQRDILEQNTHFKFDPEFHQNLQNIQSDYYRAKNISPSPVNPSPVDKRINEIYQNPMSSPLPTRGSLTGQNYSQLRKDINEEIGGYTKGKNADPLVVKSLSQLRGALDDGMERSLQASNSPYVGQWKKNFGQMESAEVLKQAVKSKPPAAGILDPNTVSAVAKNPDSEIAQLARAQSVVHKPLPPPAAPSGLASSIIGALAGHATGTGAAEGAIAGHLTGPDAQKSLFRNPLTAGLYFSPRYQDYLKNQKWQPGPGTAMDPATVARLLALQKTESSQPQSQ